MKGGRWPPRVHFEGTEVAASIQEGRSPMAESTQLRDRVRFDALRRRMFAEMDDTAKRWGFFWMALFGVVVLVSLIARGASAVQLSIQVVALALSLPSFLQLVRHPNRS